MENNKVAFLFKKEDFVTIGDLDLGYWHMPLHPLQSSLFGVAIYDQEEKKTLFYLWKVLFLGLTDAVYIFKKWLLPVVKHLRRVGWQEGVNINDIGTVGRNFQECLYWKFLARDVLGRAGWVINTSKDQIPAQDNVLLGSVVDTKSMQFKIPTKNIE